MRKIYLYVAIALLILLATVIFSFVFWLDMNFIEPVLIIWLCGIAQGGLIMVPSLAKDIDREELIERDAFEKMVMILELQGMKK